MVFLHVQKFIKKFFGITPPPPPKKFDRIQDIGPLKKNFYVTFSCGVYCLLPFIDDHFIMKSSLRIDEQLVSRAKLPIPMQTVAFGSMASDRTHPWPGGGFEGFVRTPL